GEVDGRLEGAVAVAQQHAHVVAVAVDHGQVLFAVAVQVAGRHRNRAGAGGEVGLRLEGAVAVAQQHADGGVGPVGDDEVGAAVAVDVGHRHPLRLRAGGEVGSGGEGTGAGRVAATQQQADAAAEGRHLHVRRPVAVDVAHHQDRRLAASGEVGGR